VPLQVIDFLPQVVFDRAFDASIEILGRPRAIEVSVEIRSVVEERLILAGYVEIEPGRSKSTLKQTNMSKIVKGMTATP